MKLLRNFIFFRVAPGGGAEYFYCNADKKRSRQRGEVRRDRGRPGRGGDVAACAVVQWSDSQSEEGTQNMHRRRQASTTDERGRRIALWRPRIDDRRL